MRFQKAERRKAKLRLGIAGPSGSGKTLGALMIAKGMGGRIAVIDTENDSASLYAEPLRLADGTIFTPPEFDVLTLCAPFSPERFIEAIRAASEYDILIIDSTTAEWSGVGGCLELVDKVARASFGGNSYMAWSAITPRHRAFLDALLHAPQHVIATMRSKTETAQVEDANKKKRVVKLGMKAEQRDGVEYEFTTVLDIVHDGHFAAASKDRTGLFSGDPKRITEDTGAMLLGWLESGAEPLASGVDLACDLLRTSADKGADAFREAWEGNKDGWKELLPAEQFARVLALRNDQVKKFQTAQEPAS